MIMNSSMQLVATENVSGIEIIGQTQHPPRRRIRPRHPERSLPDTVTTQ
jgi:hypothetical protein